MNKQKVQSKFFKIEGMTCSSCSAIIEENVGRLSGVNSVLVNFATEKAQIFFSEKFIEADFIELMNKLGYRAIAFETYQNDQTQKSFFTDDFYYSLFSLVMGGISMALSMGPLTQYLDHQINNLIQFVLASLILFLFSRPYLQSVYRFIATRQSNMNTLIGLGVLSAYGYSVVQILIDEHAHVYFETIPFIIGFTLMGHFLDQKAKTKVRSSIGSLYKMQIKFAAKMVEGKEYNTPVVDLKSGDIIRLRPGDKIPLDGTVLEGESHTDESMLTGESQAVRKKTGDKIFAGSLNLEGSLLFSVNKEINQGYIFEIVDYVEKAQLKFAPIQKYADKVVRYFVPLIIIFSGLTFLMWVIFNADNRYYQAFAHMISVLLIACPCALGLAVPLAVMITTTAAAEDGLLIGGGEVIELASNIDTIVFDKTGTLTEGRPEVTEAISLIDEREFFKMVGSVLIYSNHPLSKAISSFIENKKIKLDDPLKFKNVPGYGVESFIDGKKVLIGSALFLKNENSEVVESKKLGSLVYVSIDLKFAGFFVIFDPLKSKAHETVAQLKKMGMEVWMLTGDNLKVASDVALRLGIDHFKAHVLPVEKANFISELKNKGKKVAMIGDGINDAPALSLADLSFAMSNGSDVAIEISKVSILNGKIENVVSFFNRSFKTMKIIKENLFLSFFYNFLCLPLAAGVFYPFFKLSLNPIWASMAMGLSSFSVILSSLRLKEFSIKKRSGEL